MKAWILSLLLVSHVAFGATALNGPKDVLKAFSKHRPMVIMFYTTWCPACHATMPEYLKAEKALKGKVDFYTMNVEKLELKATDHTTLTIAAIPSFSAGDNEKDVRQGAHFREGGGSAAVLEDFIRDATGVK